MAKLFYFLHVCGMFGYELHPEDGLNIVQTQLIHERLLFNLKLICTMSIQNIFLGTPLTLRMITLVPMLEWLLTLVPVLPSCVATAPPWNTNILLYTYYKWNLFTKKSDIFPTKPNSMVVEWGYYQMLQIIP